MRLALALAIAATLFLAACSQPAPPADLSGVTSSVDQLTARVDAMASRIDTLTTDIGVLTEAAIELRQVASQPPNLAAALAGFTGVAVHTVPADASVSIEPGACPDDLDRGYASILGPAIGGTSIHGVPAGTHCLRTLADEDWQTAGTTINIPDGTIVTVTLLPKRQPIEE